MCNYGCVNINIYIGTTYEIVDIDTHREALLYYLCINHLIFNKIEPKIIFIYYYY